MTDWIKTPEAVGWYWWRKDETVDPMPVFIGPGPFGNNCFKPGNGWCLKERIGGQWHPDMIPWPDE